MWFMNIIFVILGFLIVCFIPGYVISFFFTKKRIGVERFFLSILLSLIFNSFLIYLLSIFKLVYSYVVVLAYILLVGILIFVNRKHVFDFKFNFKPKFRYNIFDIISILLIVYILLFAFFYSLTMPIYSWDALFYEYFGKLLFGAHGAVNGLNIDYLSPLNSLYVVIYSFFGDMYFLTHMLSPMIYMLIFYYLFKFCKELKINTLIPFILLFLSPFFAVDIVSGYADSLLAMSFLVLCFYFYKFLKTKSKSYFYLFLIVAGLGINTKVQGIHIWTVGSFALLFIDLISRNALSNMVFDVYNKLKKYKTVCKAVLFSLYSFLILFLLFLIGFFSNYMISGNYFKKFFIEGGSAQLWIAVTGSTYDMFEKIKYGLFNMLHLNYLSLSIILLLLLVFFIYIFYRIYLSFKQKTYDYELYSIIMMLMLFFSYFFLWLITTTYTVRYLTHILPIFALLCSYIIIKPLSKLKKPLRFISILIIIILLIFFMFPKITMSFKQIKEGTTIGGVTPGFEWTLENYDKDLDIKKERLIDAYNIVMDIMENNMTGSKILSYDRRLEIYLPNVTFKKFGDCDLSDINDYDYVFVRNHTMSVFDKVPECDNATPFIYLKNHSLPFVPVFDYYDYYLFDIEE